jgi:hypothetical protein
MIWMEHFVDRCVGWLRDSIQTFASGSAGKSSKCRKADFMKQRFVVKEHDYGHTRSTKGYIPGF